MAEPWEELPDLVDVTPKSGSWEDLPDAPEASWESLPDVVAPSVPNLSTPEAWQQQTVAERRRADVETLRVLFADGLNSGGDDAERTLAISNKLGLAFDDVRPALKEFERTAAAVDFDPEKWLTEYPMLAELVLRHPKLAPAVMTHNDLGPIVKALHAAGDWASDAYDTGLKAERKMPWGEIAYTARKGVAGTVGATSLIDPRTTDEAKALEAARAKRDAGGWEEQVDDEESRAIREARKDAPVRAAVLTALARGKEAFTGLDISKRQFDLMLAEVKGNDEAARELLVEIQGMQHASKPRALGDTDGLSRDLSIAISGAASTFEVLKGMGKGMSAGAAIGAIGGGLAATPAAVFVGPEAIPAGAIAGAKAGAGSGAKIGSTWASFNLEAGSTYGELRNTLTEDGHRLTPAEAAGASIAAGAIKAGLEMVSFGQSTKLVRDGIAGKLLEGMKGDATLRKLLANVAKEWFVSVGTEAVTEGAQTAVDQVMKYLAQKGWLNADRPMLEGEAIITDTQAGAFGGALFSTLGSAATVGMGAIERGRVDVADRRIAPLLELAQLPVVQAAPKEWAEAVTKTSAENGNRPIENVYVTAAEVRRFFQKEGKDDNATAAAVEELVGQGGSVAYLEAVATTDGKLAVPVEAFLGKWAPSAVGQATSQDLTTDALSLSMRERTARKAELEAKAQELAAAELARLDEEQALGNHLEAFYEEAVALLERDEKLSPKDVQQQARTATAVHRSVIETYMRDFGKSFREVFPNAPMTLRAGDEQTFGEMAAGVPSEQAGVADAMTEDQRRAALYQDDVTPLLTRRAWDETERTAGTQVGVITVPDVKGINDYEKGGHNVTNRLLGLLGNALAGATSATSARSGTDFLVEVKSQAELDELVAKMQAAAPQGVQVLGFVGKDVESAYATEKTQTDELRKLPEGDSRRVLPRGQTAFARETLTDDAFAVTAPAQQRAIPVALATKPVPAGADFARTHLLSRQMPGVLSRAGFNAAPQRSHSASLDMRGLKNINKLAEELASARGATREDAKALGDAVLRAFGDAAMRAGGADVSFAHMSGDEFAAKADSAEELADFIRALEVELHSVGVPVMLVSGERARIRPAFRSGVAEGSYGKADQQLNRSKSLEPKLAELGPAADLRRSGVLHGEARPVGGTVDRSPGATPAVGGTASREGTAAGEAASQEAQSSPAEANRPAAPGEDGSGSGQADGGLHGGEELPAWVTDGVDPAAEELVAERQRAGELRQEERVAIEAGYNWPQHLHSAREAMRRWETPQRAKETRKEHQQRQLVRRAAAEAFLRWVENDGKGIQPEGSALRPGAMRVPADVYRQTITWARELGVIDPAGGMTEILSREVPDVDPQMRRKKSKSRAGNSVYDQEVRRAAREAFETNVLGYTRQFQRDPVSEHFGLGQMVWANANPEVRRRWSPADPTVKRAPRAFVADLVEKRKLANKSAPPSTGAMKKSRSDRHGIDRPAESPGKARRSGKNFDTTALRNGTETLERYGLKKPKSIGRGKAHNFVRDIYTALERRQRDLFGRIARDNHTPEARALIAEAVANIVANELTSTKAETSGRGWYDEKYARAMSFFEQAFPELKKPLERLKFTAFIAITSNGQKVVTNFKHAARLWEEYQRTGKLPVVKDALRQEAMTQAFRRLSDFIEEHGERALSELLVVDKVENHRVKAKQLGLELKGGFGPEEMVPFASVLIGPKIGTFFGNLMGLDGFLTLDMWAMRTFNTLRGDIVTTHSKGAMAGFKAAAMRKHGSLTDAQALKLAEQYRDSFEAKGYKRGTTLERKGNELWKQANEKLNEAPLTTTDRAFLIEAVKDAQQLLKDRGHGHLSVANIQAISWFYEQRLVRALGGKVKSDASYDEVAEAWLAARREGRDVTDADVAAVRERNARGDERALQELADDGEAADDGERADTGDSRRTRGDAGWAAEELPEADVAFLRANPVDATVGADDLTAVGGANRTPVPRRRNSRVFQTDVEQDDRFAKEQAAKPMTPSQELRWRVETMLREHLLVSGMEVNTTDDRAIGDFLRSGDNAWVAKQRRGETGWHAVPPGDQEWSGYVDGPEEGFATREEAIAHAKTNPRYYEHNETNYDSEDEARAVAAGVPRSHRFIPDRVVFEWDHYSKRLMVDMQRGNVSKFSKRGEGMSLMRDVKEVVAQLPAAPEGLQQDIDAYMKMLQREVEYERELEVWRDTEVEPFSWAMAMVIPFDPDDPLRYLTLRSERHTDKELAAASKEVRSIEQLPIDGLTEEEGVDVGAQLHEAFDAFDDPFSILFELLSDGEEGFADNLEGRLDDAAYDGPPIDPDHAYKFIVGSRARVTFTDGSTRDLTLATLAKERPSLATKPPQPPAPPKLAKQWFQDDKARDQADERPLGYTDLPADRATEGTIAAFLNKNGDVATLLHEGAHGYLEIAGDKAERPDAPERVKARWAAILAWLGAENREGITTEMHERWARTWEEWLREGRAPKASLVAAFQRMKLWLTDIYRSIRGQVPGSAISPEIRAIFESMVATEDELAAAQRKAGPAMPRLPGITDAEWLEQLEEQRVAVSEAGRKAELLALKDAHRAQDQWWKAGLAKAEEQAAEEYERLPARRAQLLLMGTLPGLESDPLALDKDAVARAIGKKRVEGLITAKDGVDPDLIAAISGHVSGEAMLRDLADLRPKEAWVKWQAEFTMNTTHPSVLEERGKLRKLIDDGLAAYTEKRLISEMQALRKMNPKFGATPLEALKLAAKQVVAKRTLGRLNPAQVLAEERAAAQRKATAAAKGQWEDCAEATQEEAFKAAIYRELMRARDERDKLEELAAELGRKPAQQRLGKAAPVYRDAVDFLLERVGLRQPGQQPLTDATLTAVVAQLEGDAVIIGDPEWLAPLRAALANPTELRKLTVEQSRHLRDALEMLRAGARQRTTVMLDGRRVEREQVISELVSDIASTLPERPPRKEAHAMSAGEKLAEALNAADGALLNPIDMARDLTGDNQRSTVWRALVLPLRAAKYREAELLKHTLKPVLDALEAMPKETRKRLGESIDGRALFPTHVEEWTPTKRVELLMLALNAGNESNLQRLLDGRKMTEADLQRALDLLTPEEVAWVQTVFDACESLKEQAFALEERDTGLRPTGIEAKARELAGGTLRGGYFPAVYVPGASAVGEMQRASQLAALFDPSYSRPGTPHGHLKARSEKVVAIISLDPSIIQRHLASVVHDIAWREALKSVGSLVMDPAVDQALRRRLGDAKTREWLRLLKDIGGGGSLGEVHRVNRVMSWLKGNLGPALLGFSLPIALGDFANVAVAVGPGNPLKVRHLGTGMIDALNPQLRAAAYEMSGELKEMDRRVAHQFSQQMRDVINKPGFARSVGRALRENAFFFQEAVGKFTAMPVWLGGFRQGLADGMSPEEAARFADDLLTKVFPSHATLEKAALLRDKGFFGAITSFYGYLSVAYRTQHRIIAPLFSREFAELGFTGKGKKLGLAAGGLLGFYAAYSLLGEFLMGKGPSDDDRDDEDPESAALKYRNWAMRKFAIAPLATVPGPMASAVEMGILGKKSSPRADALTSYAATALSVFTDWTMTKEQRLLAAMRVLGLSAGLPLRPLETTGGYLLDLVNGEAEPEGPGDVASGLLYGKKKGNPATPLAP